MNFFTGLCLGFFWGATFVEICDKLKKKYAKKEIIENNFEKKYKVLLKEDGKKKTIHFGQKGADDYTRTKDISQKQRYTNRHKSRENWSKSGVNSAGFWSKHLLWNKPTISDSIKDIEKRFNVNIIKK